MCRYVPLSGCISRLPVSTNWPAPWPDRLKSRPLGLSSGSEADESFQEDTRHWSALIADVYSGGVAINWTNVRNVMDMNAGYGG